LDRVIKDNTACDRCDRRMVIAVAVLTDEGQREERRYCWSCWRLHEAELSDQRKPQE
jgi:hypothetical protein